MFVSICLSIYPSGDLRETSGDLDNVCTEIQTDIRMHRAQHLQRDRGPWMQSDYRLQSALAPYPPRHASWASLVGSVDGSGRGKAACPGGPRGWGGGWTTMGHRMTRRMRCLAGCLEKASPRPQLLAPGGLKWCVWCGCVSAHMLSPPPPSFPRGLSLTSAPRHARLDPCTSGGGFHHFTHLRSPADCRHVSPSVACAPRYTHVLARVLASW